MRIAIIGYGKMGHMIEQIALERGHEIAARIDIGDTFDLKGADVAIEFTTPATAEENIRKAWAQGVPVVCGSTGWKPEELRVEGLELREVDSKKLIVESKTGKTMLIWSSNYSVGVNIFFELNKALAAAMAAQPQYTPSIKEIHHIHKLDKPSGTAKTLSEAISHQLSAISQVSIESIREGEVPGTHEVTWDSEEDTIVITHIAKGRRGFALGAVLAAEQMLK
ncbi:MAG: 4-hydroxy-tetrahydrodipicolinate reductase [Paludibacteraceae bacterium]|nr:4-hydroxy-tetrahydrodipicolinate reductase [Paludibacteraceae bacterium]